MPENGPCVIYAPRSALELMDAVPAVIQIDHRDALEPPHVLANPDLWPHWAPQVDWATGGRSDADRHEPSGGDRADIRAGRLTAVTTGLAPGFVQANLAVLPKDEAYDFLLFCQRNPRPCPVIEVTDIGSPEPVAVAPGADLRTDLPRYRIYKDGVLADEVTDVTPFWRDDLVAFLLGCSFTFEWALLDAGIPIRHIDEGKNVAMWKTSIACRPAGRFHGPMVVSMRPIPTAMVSKAVTASARFPNAHGAPVHVGDPAALGIADVNKPDWGDSVGVRAGEVPVFWACGVTPQAVALASKPAFMITHSPGHMFITDLPNHALAAI